MAQDREITIDLALTKAGDGRAELTLSTHKLFSGGLVSSARVSWVARGIRTHAMGLGTGCGDFDKRAAINREARATQKAIDAQHAAAFTPENIATITQLARDWYAGRNDVSPATDTPKERLEYLRAELRAERISTGELVELQGLAQHIEPGDVELLEAAGVPESPAQD